MHKSDVTPIAKYPSPARSHRPKLRSFTRKDFFVGARRAHVWVEFPKNSGAVKHVQLGDERHAHHTTRTRRRR